MKAILCTIFLIAIIYLLSLPIQKTIKNHKQDKQHQLQLLEEQNQLLREQLNRDK